jgi:hypothetical protein
MSEKKQIAEEDQRIVSPTLGKIKDELFLITFFILCSGLVYTDSYYQRFGIKYQFLDLSITHIIYKGLTLILHYQLIFIPYLLAILVMIVEIQLTKKGLKKFLDYKIPFAYLFLFINLLILYPIAEKAGKSQALVDMNEKTTGLPKIMYLETDEITLQYPKEKFALFSNNGSFILFFQLSTDIHTQIPIIKSVRTSDVKFLDTSQ